MHFMARSCLVCMRIGGARITEIGHVPTERPVLVLMNHQSLLDIPTGVALCRPNVPPIVTRKLLRAGHPASCRPCCASSALRSSTPSRTGDRPSLSSRRRPVGNRAYSCTRRDTAGAAASSGRFATAGMRAILKERPLARVPDRDRRLLGVPERSRTSSSASTRSTGAPRSWARSTRPRDGRRGAGLRGADARDDAGASWRRCVTRATEAANVQHVAASVAQAGRGSVAALIFFGSRKTRARTDEFSAYDFFLLTQDYSSLYRSLAGLGLPPPSRLAHGRSQRRPPSRT